MLYYFTVIFITSFLTKNNCSVILIQKMNIAIYLLFVCSLLASLNGQYFKPSMNMKIEDVTDIGETEVTKYQSFYIFSLIENFFSFIKNKIVNE